MKNIRIQKGLNIPLKGKIEGDADHIPLSCRHVALLGKDYTGMKPTLAVEPGDKVRRGELLFTDKKSPKVRYTAPGTGKVVAVNRGYRRAFESLVIELEEENPLVFTDISTESQEKIREALLESGMWTLIKERPFGKTANPDTVPSAIFVNVLDTNPLAPDVEKIIRGREVYFYKGLKIVSELTEGSVYVCLSPDTNLKIEETSKIEAVSFSGPHPAGNTGTHIHFLHPVSRQKTVWEIGAQELAEIGEFFDTGVTPSERIVALTGTGALTPSYIKARIGASMDELLKDQTIEAKVRKISGSPLSGFDAAGNHAYLGRYHNQISLIPEGGKRELLGWLSPGFNLHSIKRTVASALLPSKKFDLTTDENGGERAIVPVGSYEKVMPMDILPTFLLRSLCVKDIEEAEKLGALELVEEDLALCSYVCPSKIDFQGILRENLTLIEKEG